MQTIDLGQDFQRSIVKLAVSRTVWLDEHREYFYPELFEFPQTAHIVRLLTAFYDTNEVAPSAQVLKGIIQKEKGEFRKLLMVEYAEIGKQELDASKVAFVTGELKRFVERQTLQKAIVDASMKFESGDFDGVRSTFDTALSFGDTSSKSSIMYFDDAAIEARLNYDPVHDKIPTLWKSFDVGTKGGPARKELWLFMAPTNVGKSIALVNVAANALYQGRNVLYVTNEMSAEKVAFRFDQRLVGMSLADIRKNKGSFRDKLHKFRSLYRGDLHIKEYPARDATIADIAAYDKSLARKLGWESDILALDYLDECKRPKAEKDYIAIGHVTAALHGFAKKSNKLVWSATQTGRAALSKVKFDLDDVGDSWEKVKIADGVVAMCQTEDEYDTGSMRFYRLKDRDNKRQKSKPTLMETDFDRMLIREKAA